MITVAAAKRRRLPNRAAAMVLGMRLGLALVALTGTAVGFSYANHAPVLPLLAAELGLSDFQLGLLTGGLALAGMTAMSLAPPLADRGPKLLVGAGLAVVLASNLLFAASPSFAGLLAAKTLNGLGGGAAFIGGVRYVSGLYGAARSHAGQGLYGSGYPTGSAIALLVMPALAIGAGWRGAFVLSSLAIAAVLVAWLVAPEVASRERGATAAAAMRCPNCWWTALQHAAGFGLSLAAASWITTFLLREFGLPLELAGILGSLLLVMTLVSRIGGGVIASAGHRIGSLALMRVSQLAILAGIALLAFPSRPLALALLGVAVIGVGSGLPYAAVFNTAAASLPRAPGAAQGLTAAGGMASTLVGPPLMGYAVQVWGFTAAWPILGAVSLLALGATAVMRGEEELTP